VSGRAAERPCASQTAHSPLFDHIASERAASTKGASVTLPGLGVACLAGFVVPYKKGPSGPLKIFLVGAVNLPASDAAPAADAANPADPPNTG